MQLNIIRNPKIITSLFYIGHWQLKRKVKMETRGGSTLEQGRLPRVPQTSALPQMWHETLFDELKPSTHRYKKEHSVASKYTIMRFRTPLGELMMLIQTH